MSWEGVEHADGFNVVSSSPIKEGPYPNSVQSFNVSNGRNILKLTSKYCLILNTKFYFYYFMNIMYMNGYCLFPVTKLSPGITYTINVTPYNKRYIGMKYTIVTKTDGKIIELLFMYLIKYFN